MRPRTLTLPVLVSAILTLLQVPACGLNTSGELESEARDDAGVIDAQSKGGSAGASGGSATGGKGGAAGKAGQGGSSGQAGSSGSGNSAGAGGAGEGGTSGSGGSSETGGSAGAGGSAGTAGQGGATPDGGAGTTGQGGGVQDSGPDVVDAAPDVIEAGPDSGPVCSLQDTGHPECNACMQQNCMSACQGCAANSECVVLVNCIAGCNGGSGCQSDCWDAHPNGHDAADQLGGKDGCLRDHCNSQCSWLPDVSSPGCTVSPAPPAKQTGSLGWLIGAMSAAGIAIAVARRRPGL